MNITISVPLKSEIVFNGIKIALAKNKGDSWKKGQLEDFQDKSGVYILHYLSIHLQYNLYILKYSTIHFIIFLYFLCLFSFFDFMLVMFY